MMLPLLLALAFAADATVLRFRGLDVPVGEITANNPDHPVSTQAVTSSQNTAFAGGAQVHQSTVDTAQSSPNDASHDASLNQVDSQAVSRSTTTATATAKDAMTATTTQQHQEQTVQQDKKTQTVAEQMASVASQASAAQKAEADKAAAAKVNPLNGKGEMVPPQYMVPGCPHCDTENAWNGGLVGKA
mmetsp:Transcript_25583/g.45436  ORF Transcript_25583/g.45436 Transcript_25583/m.45436 type:complete len:188 (+) Transcript_25583:10-573(+)